MIKEYYKHPRLYLKDRISENAVLSLSENQAHYLKNVLRNNVGDIIRLFNGKDGEWAARILSFEKKSGSVQIFEKLKEQPRTKGRVHLYFAPIKKQRMDILMEKAVELGVDEFHPVITHRTENRKLNIERLEAQIFEAAEQCERLELPVLHPAIMLPQVLRTKRDHTLFACLEREESAQFCALDIPEKAGFLVGPEGGLDDEEIELIRRSDVKPVSLGDAVFRAETASIVCLTHAMLLKQRA
jgi:16S rRNA (uracil1498-N3)-methyltransferase